jgi:hypothetical protein
MVAMNDRDQAECRLGTDSGDGAQAIHVLKFQ